MSEREPSTSGRRKIYYNVDHNSKAAFAVLFCYITSQKLSFAK